VLAPLRWLYDYAWFVGFLVAGASYVILMQRAPARAGQSSGRRNMIATESPLKDRFVLRQRQMD